MTTELDPTHLARVLEAVRVCERVREIRAVSKVVRTARESLFALCTPAFIRALVERVKELEAQTELHKRWHKKPAHGSCCTCQRCGLDYDTCRCVLDECADELELLKVRCQELEKDRERLDWLLENGASVGSYTEGRDWFVFDNSGALMSVAWQPTPRQVIDAAREREGGSTDGQG